MKTFSIDCSIFILSANGLRLEKQNTSKIQTNVQLINRYKHVYQISTD